MDQYLKVDQWQQKSEKESKKDEQEEEEEKEESKKESISGWMHENIKILRATSPFINRFREWTRFIYYPFADHY